MENNYMTINDAIDAMILALQAIFGDTYTYYPENMGQAMQLPCFFVSYINGTEDYLVGKRYDSKSHFIIHGHVENSNSMKKELNNIATLLNQLEYITLPNGDLIRLENRNSKIEDNDVIFYADINVHLLKLPEEDTKMESINVNGGIKNGQ